MSDTWKPAEKAWIENDIEGQLWLLEEPKRALWALIKVEPHKWQQSPWGDQGNGFFVVALFGNNVLWYNDIEDGYNISSFTRFGIIDEYFSNQNELHHSINYLYSRLRTRGSCVLGAKISMENVNE